MRKQWLRVVGEWKALRSAFKHWRLISPCIRCSRCGGWFDQTNVCMNGVCWECDRLIDDEVDAWIAGHAQGWTDCLAEMNRQQIRSALKLDEQQIPLDLDGEVPF